MTIEELAELLVDDVALILGIDDVVKRTDALEALAATAFVLAWEDVTSVDVGTRDDTFAASMSAAVALTDPDGTEEQQERVAKVFATAAVRGAELAGFEPGSQVTWRTMRDDDVRDTHVPMEGVTQAAGTPFIVGGVPLLYPGQPMGPPEIWINCRCRLEAAVTAGGDMTTMTATNGTFFVLNDDLADIGTLKIDAPSVLSSNALVAVSDKPWSQFSASDYSIEQWRRACLLKMPGGDPNAKSTYKLPVREPGGALNRNGVHAAAAALAGARGGVNAPAEAKAAAKRKLRGLYRQLGEDPPESLAADLAGDSVTAAWPKGTSPPGTHDAPGWITHPRETQRLRNYWTKGAGALKIRWGMPGDFDRCRRQLAKYVQNPHNLAGTCANLHFVALGFWPGQGPHASIDPPTELREDPVTAAFAAAAELDETEPETLPPLEWFQAPPLTAATPATMEDDHYFGHLATWGTCHVGVEGACTEAPHSNHDYAYFRTGELMTAGGPVPVGQITVDTGHAARDLGPHATIAHYDDTGTVVADVAAGEDDYGIWFNGMLRPGITDIQRHALRAGALSGDWRRIGGNLELVAALVVNVPGFPIPRIEMAATAGVPTALVAAAIVTVDPNAEFADNIARIVVERMRSENERRSRAHELTRQIRHLRASALVEVGS
jgi:hypothetical protein